MRHSAIYEGAVEHCRLEPRRHAFRHRLFFLYVDLEELPTLFDGRWLWSAARPNLVWFRRADYLGERDVSLREAVLGRVEAELGRRPSGPVRLLTHMRTLGYVFNPVSFYYCFDEQEELEAVVAEITNTPWGERHAYVLDARSASGGAGDLLTWRFRKAFHVSPFLDMDYDYEWSFSVPGDGLEVRMTNHGAESSPFHVRLGCERREIGAASLAGALFRHPLLTLRVHAAIYWQAARLWTKRTPFFTHPEKRVLEEGASTR